MVDPVIRQRAAQLLYDKLVVDEVGETQQIDTKLHLKRAEAIESYVYRRTGGNSEDYVQELHRLRQGQLPSMQELLTYIRQQQISTPKKLQQIQTQCGRDTPSCRDSINDNCNVRPNPVAGLKKRKSEVYDLTKECEDESGDDSIITVDKENERTLKLARKDFHEKRPTVFESYQCLSERKCDLYTDVALKWTYSDKKSKSEGLRMSDFFWEEISKLETNMELDINVAFKCNNGLTLRVAHKQIVLYIVVPIEYPEKEPFLKLMKFSKQSPVYLEDQDEYTTLSAKYGHTLKNNSKV